MVKQTKRSKRSARVSAKKLPQGFDYGCLPHVMALASFEFPDHLSNAPVDAVAYSSMRSESVNGEVPAIVLVGKGGRELAKAFEEFNAWSQVTDPDSVEITFVFRRSGGYVLAISVEHSRLQRRCLGFDRAHRALLVGPIWIKPIRSINPVLKSFREHCSASISPFFLTAATYIGPASVLSPSVPPELSPIRGLQPLLKFEVTFIDEADVRLGSTAWAALKTVKAWPQKWPRDPGKKPKPRPDEIATQRIKTLAHHFPVTLERIRRSSSVPLLMLGLAECGVMPWQIEQALCNLVLSAEMGRGAYFAGLSARKAKDAIIQAISSRYELADGGDIPTFTIEDVSKQVVADGNALLRYLKKKRCTDLAGVRAALQSASVLQAATVVDIPAEWSALP